MTLISLFSPFCDKRINLHTAEQDHFAESDRTGTNMESFDWLNLVRSESQDLSLPKELLFLWRCSGGSLVSAEVECAEDPQFKTGRLHFPAAESNLSAHVHSLKVGTTYYWHVKGKDARGQQVESDVRKFLTEPNPPRWVKAEGVSNVRDCGAWRTKTGQKIRQGLLYRGGEMNLHMTITENGIRFLDEQIGIKTLLDVRYKDELARLGGNGSAMPDHVRWISIPFFAYAHIFDEGMPQHFAQAFRVLLDEDNLPVYLHCWGGADRTGTFVFLVNAVLGVDEESLLLDYELTSLAIWGQRSRNLDLFQE